MSFVELDVSGWDCSGKLIYTEFFMFNDSL